MKILAVSPHLHSGVTTQTLMRDVLLALTPAWLASLYFFGWRAFWLVLICVVFSVLTEYLTALILRKKNTISDLSAVVTGVLLAFVLPPSLPLWMAALGAVFAVLIVKELFGGLGYNIFNPALGGRAFLLASFPVFMTTWIQPFDALTTATPLAAGLKIDELSLFLGNIPGSLGETSALALLLGAVYLLCRQVIDWRLPASYIGTVALFMFLAGQNVAFQVLAGGLLLGAFFMATDYTTSPMSRRGKWIFGIGCGILTSVIRLWGGYPEGVCYSILIMNMFVPLIDRMDETKK
jgi:electron transport complex protein RnfD